MNTARTALVAGSTGLTGRQLLDLLLQDERYARIIAVSRNPLPPHPKLTTIQTDFSGLTAHAQELKADDVFCCLGTTMRKAKSKEAFREVDFDYPLTLAKLSKENGAQQFLLVSALGANRNSSIFYNRVKGEIEEAVSGVGFRTLHILRPSLLMGHREEQRSGEDAAKIFYRFFGFLIPARYKGIEAVRVARAMVAFAGKDATGTFVHESGELQQY